MTDLSTSEFKPEHGDQAAGKRLSDRYARSTGRCPTREALEEILYIWSENEAYWTEFPAQEDLFFQSNFSQGQRGVMLELVGLSVEEATQALTTDPDFPLSQDRAPSTIADITFYEFSGGNSVYLIVVRNARVASIYFLAG